MTASVPATHKKSTASKSHSTAVHANPATTETAAAPGATATPTSPAIVAAPPDTSIQTLANDSLAHLNALEGKLNLNIVVHPNDVAQRRALARVTDTAISLASDIVRAAPERFPDLAGLPAAADYVGAMGQVADRAMELGTHLRKSVQNQRTPAAQQTLVLYAIAKGLGRITDNETMREKVLALRAEVAPKRSLSKPKVTKDEKAAKRLAKTQANKLAKAQAAVAKLSVGAGATAPAPAAAVSPASVSPAPAASGVPSVAPPSPVVVGASAPAAQPAPVATPTPVAPLATNGAVTALHATPASS